MSQFDLKVPKEDLNLWAEKYWQETNQSDENRAFVAGREILESGLSEQDLKENLKKIIDWKSPRVVHYFDSNPPEKIKAALEKATAPATTAQEAVEALT